MQVHAVDKLVAGYILHCGIQYIASNNEKKPATPEHVAMTTDTTGTALQAKGKATSWLAPLPVAIARVQWLSCSLVLLEVKQQRTTEMTSHSSSHHDRAAAARSRCNNPLTWPELQPIISTGDLYKLVRSEEQEQTYCKARSKVRFISCVYCAAAALLPL